MFIVVYDRINWCCCMFPLCIRCVFGYGFRLLFLLGCVWCICDIAVHRLFVLVTEGVGLRAY